MPTIRELAVKATNQISSALTTSDEQQSDIARAIEAIQGKALIYDTLWRYYDGDHPLVFSHERLRDFFKKPSVSFIENWCAVVVDSAAHRLQLQGFNSADAGLDDTMREAFQLHALDLEASDIHESTLVTGEAIVIAWREQDDEGDEVTDVYLNDARRAHVFYKRDRPKQKDFAAKYWTRGKQTFLNLYYADRIEYYETDTPWVDAKARSFRTRMAAEENPHNQVPVFHWRTERRAPKSALTNILTIQDAVNKLFSDLMVASDLGSFKQRWIISGADLGQLKQSPFENWVLPASDGAGQDTEVGEFTETTLKNFIDGMQALANAIGIISHTPRHYFYQQGGDPSGDALVAMEAPLNSKVEDYILHFIPPWRELMQFLLRLDGNAQVKLTDISPQYKKPATVLPVARSTIRLNETQSGIPLITSLRWEGRDDEEIAQLEKDRAAEESRQATTAAAAFVRAQREMDQNEAPNLGDGEDAQEA